MSKTNPFFSVIVPAYNAEDRIEKLLRSIQEQSFTDYELIVVCDSCTDRTAEIARKYTDKVYEVDYHQDGQTRNYGLDHAQGTWVLFADDDDWFMHEFVFGMIASVVGKHGEDILAFGFIWKYRGYAVNTKDNMWIAVWNKCWRRDFIGNTRFSTVPYHSDVDFHNSMMEKHPKIATWDMPFYYYNFMRKGSLSRELKDNGVMYKEIDYTKIKDGEQ